MTRLLRTGGTELRTRRPVIQLVISLALIVVTAEALIYPSQNDVPNGLFSLSIGSMNIRLLDILVLAIFFSSLGRQRSQAKDASVYYLVLVGSALYVGFTASLNFSDDVRLGTVLTQSRFLLYLLLLAPLMRAITSNKVLEAGTTALYVMTGPLLVSGAISLVKPEGIQIPGFPLSQYGGLGGDIGTIVGVLAFCGLGKAIEQGRASWCALWLLFPLLTNQRASILTTTVFGGVAVLILWRRRGLLDTIRRRQANASTLILLWIVAILMSASIILVGRLPIANQLASGLSQSFTSVGKLASADTRLMEISYAASLFKERPLFGYGLGVDVQFYDIFHGKTEIIESAHNFVADVLLRGGLVGAVLAMGLFASALAGPRPWIAAKLVWSVGLLSLLGKGLLEPAFDKYRLVFLVALTLTSVSMSRCSAVVGGQLSNVHSNHCDRESIKGGPMAATEDCASVDRAT